jgi:putative restriction endonuclease
MSDVFSKILSLRRGNSKNLGIAPHKPVLLLAVIELFEEGKVDRNWIEPNADLLLIFRDIWDSVVDTEHTPNFSLPFYHLGNETSGIWSLVLFPGHTIPLTKSKSIKSYRALIDSVIAAKLSDDLYTTLLDPVEREAVKYAIMQKYFPDIIERDSVYKKSYSKEIEKQILYDPHTNYVRRVKRRQKNLSKEELELEVAARSSTFKTQVLKQYQYQCAVTGLKVKLNNRVKLIDACHIQPFAEFANDSIKNGIALCPTMHRAFDSGMIAISDNYTVMVNSKVKDYSPDNLFTELDKRTIILPDNPDFYPSIDYLREHRQRFRF